ncbi:hypothetical protein CDV26_04300 [Francisella halioticida]|uniref:HpcH/HpaI aldolase/citrate lyase domain-containing protein n=1 Tax=Francisella halioticida TaxID=549298 RepID=A0ABN5B241_9GAMM|nr:aldolase/citrate lyase family protein [Francisella halioticida]ASG67718.1 hypothetical protein CDV26_04300 [Francisella halioticida]
MKTRHLYYIESTESFRNIHQIADSSNNLVGLALGGGDLVSELGVAKNANLIALDVPFNDIRVSK